MPSSLSSDEQKKRMPQKKNDDIFKKKFDGSITDRVCWMEEKVRQAEESNGDY